MPARTNNLYMLQQLTLLPFIQRDWITDSVHQLDLLDSGTLSNLVKFLITNNLGPPWNEEIDSKVLSRAFTQTQLKKLKGDNQLFAVRYLQQKAAMYEVSSLLEQNSVVHLFFKGSHTREVAYTRPATRLTCDIDLLVASKDREFAIDLLANKGYSLHINNDNTTHEVSLNKGLVSIDLHWHILRPGRVSSNLTEQLLSNRIRHGHYFACSPEEHLMILLIHPVFTEYSTITQSGLIKLLDIVLWLNVHDVDWYKLRNLLYLNHVQTPAWITLQYLNLITGMEFPSTFVQTIKPSSWRAMYLNFWIKNNLPARLKRWSMFVKIGFTLLAHDTLAHSVSFAHTQFSQNLKKHGAHR